MYFRLKIFHGYSDRVVIMMNAVIVKNWKSIRQEFKIMVFVFLFKSGLTFTHLTLTLTEPMSKF